MLMTRNAKNAGHPLIRVGSRRWFLQTGMAGLGGLSLAQLIGLQASAADPAREKKAVILFWLSGGPSQIDMWDPKPDAPREIRGPYGVIPTKISGVQFCEHLPLQASIADKLSIIRSVDCSASNHTPITMQAGNPLARRTDDGRDGGGYPSMGSVAAKFRGPNVSNLPAFVGLANSWEADVWESGDMGHQFAPSRVRNSPASSRCRLASTFRDCKTATVCELNSIDLAANSNNSARWTASINTLGKPTKWSSRVKFKRRSTWTRNPL